MREQESSAARHDTDVLRLLRPSRATMLLSGALLAATLAFGVIRYAPTRTAAEHTADLVGQQLPNLSLPDLTGRMVSLSALGLRRPAALWLVASSDCLACLAEADDWASVARDNPQLDVIAIVHSSDREAVASLVRSEHLPFLVLQDSLGRALAALDPRLPSPVRLYVRHGRIVLASRGKLTSPMAFLAQALRLSR